jgi:cyclopropane fatty-acyl-phospholipid synthase-like methyltransferase
MSRADWLKRIRRLNEERYDALFAPVYDANWGAIAPTHRQFLDAFLTRCPPRGVILDAPCGTGKYWPIILAADRTIFGIDQSRAMLDCARSKFPDVPTEKLGLQEMHFQEAFDAAICMDSMEFVCPEDWPLVLENFYRALPPAAYLYFTVEIAPEKDIEDALAAGRQAGLPLVYGEWPEGDGYHHYPTMQQVREWVHLARFFVVEEAVGDEYHHFLVQRPGDPDR